MIIMVDDDVQEWVFSTLYCKIIRDARIRNKNVLKANRQRVLIGWRELKWKRHEAVDAG